MFRNLKLGKKLLVAFLVTGIVPFAIIGGTSLFLANNVLSDQAFEKLKVVQEIKKAQVEEYFKKCRSDIIVLAKNPAVAEAVNWFLLSFNSDGSINEKAYEYNDSRYGTSMAEFVEAYGYYDIMLITTEGKVIYTFKKEFDLGENVVAGSLKETSLGKAFSDGLKGVTIRDFEGYGPSADKYISFILAPLYKQTENASGTNEPLGVVALKLTNAPVNTIVQRRSGMGETGETVLVGKKDGKTTYRTDPAGVDDDGINRAGAEISSSYLEKAFAGESGAEIYKEGKAGQLISYDPLNLEGLEWVIVSGIETAEAFTAFNLLKLVVGLVALVCIAGIIAIGVLFTRSVIHPINSVVDRIRDIAEGEGDLTSRLEVKMKDEIGDLAGCFNIFVEKLQSIIRDIAANSNSLDSSSSVLADLSGKMSDQADSMSEKSKMVAAASEEVSSNMEAVANAMEEVSANIGMVASSTEEMTATINEIAQNSEKANVITSQAVAQAKKTSVRVGELGTAAKEIDKVTETITEISAQTNLLALNATIEAARAGEAGKGFAVVAEEIKGLARQTAKSTQEIKQRIDRIQASAGGTALEINQIFDIIKEVNEIVSATASAVEEQSVTTREIAGNVAQASSRIQEMTENLAVSSAAAGEIAEDISEFNQTASEVSSGGTQINTSSEELRGLASQLKNLVSLFKV